MNTIAKLCEKIKDKNFRTNQFAECSLEKNILFVNPQLCGKDMYKMIVPSISMIDDNIFAALTDIQKYNEEFHLIDLGELNLEPEEIIWADFIVVPFTTMNLHEGSDNLFSVIRQINPNCKIMFFVDFNFYELDKEHPFFSIFDNADNKANVEKNILASDTVMTTNRNLQQYLLKKISEIALSTYSKFQTYLTGVGCLPFMFDLEIMFQNIEYNPEKPVEIKNRKIVAKVNEINSNVNKTNDYANQTEKKKSENKATTKKGSSKGNSKTANKKGR